jgi:hypothetical protein
MLRYTWAKSGFPVEEQDFKNVNELSFDFESSRCKNLECTHHGVPFIQCSWPLCRLVLCLKCFFTSNHRH